MFIRKKGRLTALLLTLALTLTACGGAATPPQASTNEPALEKVAFVLDWTPNTNHTGVYVALAKGYYAEAGLNVEIIQPPEDGALSAVGTGQAQFGVDFQESLGAALTSAHPLPVTAVAAIIAHNTSGILSLSEDNIHRFKDLEGKTYATWDMPTEQAILASAMAADGGDFAQVYLVPHSGADAISLLQSGVDAVWVYEAWDVAKAALDGVSYNYMAFADANPVLDYYTPIIVANNDLLANRPHIAQAFLAATSRGYQDAIANPSEAAEILLQAVPELDPALINASQAILATTYQGEGTPWGIIEADRWQGFYDWMSAESLLPQDLGATGYSNDFLPSE